MATTETIDAILACSQTVKNITASFRLAHDKLNELGAKLDRTVVLASTWKDFWAQTLTKRKEIVDSYPKIVIQKVEQPAVAPPVVPEPVPKPTVKRKKAPVAATRKQPARKVRRLR